MPTFPGGPVERGSPETQARSRDSDERARLGSGQIVRKTRLLGRGLEFPTMPLRLNGSCRCGAVGFSLDSHTPHPYQLCYCSICRKTGGGGGYAINIMGVAGTLEMTGKDALTVFRAEMPRANGSFEKSSGQRHFCKHCASALWLYDPTWPDLVHPFASAIDTPLPAAPERVHLMLAFKPDWVKADFGPKDRRFDGYPEQSIEDWHKSRGLWID
jgi:hypothetical protein